jgi:hypothetical protein
MSVVMLAVRVSQDQVPATMPSMMTVGSASPIWLNARCCGSQADQRVDCSGGVSGVEHCPAGVAVTECKGGRVGFGRELEVNSGPWTLTLIDDDVDAAAIERWNHLPE